MANPTCPQCNGTRQMVALVCGKHCEEKIIVCSLCKGAGWVTPTRDRWYTTGRMLRAARLDRGLTLRGAALALSLSPTELSRLEQGLGDPTSILDMLLEVRP